MYILTEKSVDTGYQQVQGKYVTYIVFTYKMVETTTKL